MDKLLIPVILVFFFNQGLCQTSVDDSLKSIREGKFYVSHDTLHEAAKLLNITNSEDRKDVFDTTITILSVGEGWFDRDSLPIGKWRFFSKDENGKVYLFKEGIFKKTTPEMFTIVGTDLSSVNKIFHYSQYKIKFMESSMIKYIKCGEWTYYHRNGKVWRKMLYQCDSLCIEYIIAKSDEGNNSNSYKLLGTTNQSFDYNAYIKPYYPMLEFDEIGNLSKKLIFTYFNRVVYKALYDKNGNLKKEFGNASDFQGNSIWPFNY